MSHNAIRDIFCRLCHAAGLRPKVEKPDLLRPRPLVGSREEDGKSRKGSRGPDGRRPADVFLPALRLGKPAALDFAVTSGLSIDLLPVSEEDASLPCSLYANRKRQFLDTAAHCQEEGIDFIPMIVEASSGSWGVDARNLFREVSKTAARLTGDPYSVKLEQCLQNFSISLHRANARAVLRRAPAIPPPQSAIATAQTALARAEAENAADDMSVDRAPSPSEECQ